MASEKPRQMTQATMLGQVEQVLRRGQPNDPPAYTLILGAGASFGSIPTAKQMLGIPNQGIIHPQCIPAWLHRRESNPGDSSPEFLSRCVKRFWERFKAENPSFVRSTAATADDGERIGFKDGLPDGGSVAQAYTAVFNQGIAGGINTAAEARTYLRDITLPVGKQVQLNGTHFFLASLLSLQRRIGEAAAGDKPPYVGRRPFARTIFTTNFDPLLQISLQLFHLLYYMTDRPDLLSADALQTDDHPAIHLFYAHGSVHRPFLANTQAEIDYLSRNARELASYIGTHGVIVLGYSGWDDCLLRALKQTSNFSHNLYWLARDESSLSPTVSRFLREHPSAYWVQISDGGEFMASLHNRLCPGMRFTELLNNPIRPLREQLERVVLTGVEPKRSISDEESSGAEGAAVAKPTTPEEFRQQILQLLADADNRLASDVSNLDPAERLRRAEHQADLAYANDNWDLAIELYKKIIDDADSSTKLKAKALIRRAFSYGKQGNPTEAIADYTRAIGLPGAPFGQVAMALNNRGLHYDHEGKPEEAIADYTRVIEMPDAPQEQVARAFNNRGLRYSAQGKPEEAVADYTRVIEMPDAPPEQVARALINRGVCYGQQGKPEEEITDCTRAIELPGAQAAQMAIALVNRGLRYGQQGKPEEAVIDHTRVIEMPNAPPEQMAKALNSRGFYYGQQGKPEEEITDFTRAIELSGAPPEQVVRALINRGLCYGQQDKPEEAIADHTRAIEMPGAPPEQVAVALINRGLRYSAQGKPEEAIADYTRVIEMPDAPPEQVVNAFINRGVCYGQQGKPEEEIADCTRAIELPGAQATQMAIALVNRGLRYSAQGKPEEAIADYTRAIELPGAPPKQVAKARNQRDLQLKQKEWINPG